MCFKKQNQTGVGVGAVELSLAVLSASVLVPRRARSNTRWSGSQSGEGLFQLVAGDPTAPWPG